MRRVSDYVTAPTADGKAEWPRASALCAGPRLARDLRVLLVEPLVAHLRARGGALTLPGLTSELRLHLLRHLDARSLVAVMATCNELRGAASDEALWERLFRADHGRDPSSAPPPEGFRRAYANAEYAAAQRRRAEELAEAAVRRRLAAEPARPEPGPFPGMPFGEPHFPGMIGGDYDRLPGGIPGRMPFGGPPLGPHGGGRGPLGDPDGPLPGGAVPPGSRYDPIHPDVDGGFGGAGGIPFPGRGPGHGRRGGQGRGRGRGLHPDLPDPSRFY